MKSWKVSLVMALPFFALMYIFTSCKSYNSAYHADVAKSKYLHATMKNLTDIIVHDIFSPPVASRNYAYASIAAYEAGRWSDTSYISLAGQLNGLVEVSLPPSDKEISFPISSVAAMIEVGRKFIFSEEKMEAYRQSYLDELKAYRIDPEIIEASIAYGNAVAQDIIAWASKDNYNQTRSFPKYTITDDQSRWKPTPPTYMEGIEPHWSKIRPFVLDSAQQFKPDLPTAFSTDKNSKFYKEVLDVYDTGKNLSDEQKSIASFWDCNPFVVKVTGHVMHASKKVTPGGHWVGITKLACEKADADFVKTLHAYALTTIALADGFISCWDEKYRSNLTRPETVINEHIDKDWLPALQTPPFPEYTSGHSVISSSAATVLTSLYGDNFDFMDDTEVEYGLPVRSFKSFYDAANEAAISRLYGGIHYRPAIENGLVQGSNIGKFVLNSINFKSSDSQN